MTDDWPAPGPRGDDPVCPRCQTPLELGVVQGRDLAWVRRGKWLGGLLSREPLGNGWGWRRLPARRCPSCGSGYWGPNILDDDYLDDRYDPN